MDREQFDQLTKLFGAGKSRRFLLRGFAAGVLAGVLGHRASVSATSCGANGDACDPADDTCCQDYTCDPGTNTCQEDCGVNGTACSTDLDCCSYSFCASGFCSVDAGCVVGNDSCTTDEDCCQSQQGIYACVEGNRCRSVCSHFGFHCETTSCCPDEGLSCLSDGRCGYCNGEGEACATRFDCCGDEFICTAEGLCGHEVTCRSYGDSCVESTDCCDGLVCDAGVGNLCSAAVCSESGEECQLYAPCCEGLICRDNGSCEGTEATCREQGESCDDEGACCAGTECKGDGTCQVCFGSGGSCENDLDCCHGFFCQNPGSGSAVCALEETVCVDEGGECDDATALCCAGLVCDDGTCEAVEDTCAREGDACGVVIVGTDAAGCCEGLVCDSETETCLVPVPPAGTASVTIHLAECPTGTNDIFGQCHDDGLGGVTFTITSKGEVSAAETGLVVTDGAGVASAGVGAGAVTVAEDPGVTNDYLGSYVYCSEQNSGTVLYDGSADSGAVGFAVAGGDVVICDWYNITAADSDDTTPTPTSGGATALPGTGAGVTGDGTTPWLGAAALGGVAAVLAARRLRTGGAAVDETG